MFDGKYFAALNAGGGFYQIIGVEIDIEELEQIFQKVFEK